MRVFYKTTLIWESTICENKRISVFLSEFRGSSIFSFEIEPQFRADNPGIKSTLC